MDLCPKCGEVILFSDRYGFCVGDQCDYLAEWVWLSGECILPGNLQPNPNYVASPFGYRFIFDHE